MRLSLLLNPVVVSNLLHGWLVQATTRAYSGMESRINCHPNFIPTIDPSRDYPFNKINHNDTPSGIAAKTLDLSGRCSLKITVPR